ncbi:hypothetical protein AtNW77_Chr5g0146511 [Arabidopsis thaliana]
MLRGSNGELCGSEKRRDRELKRDSDLSLPGEDSRATRAAEIVVPTEYLV